MRAITISDGRLVAAERPVPEPGPGEVVVRVHGAGCNRADLLQRAGRYPAPPGVPVDVPGLEFAGEISAVGDEVADRRVGEAVCGIVGGGAQAEYVAVPAAHCAPVPASLELVDMGAVPEAFVTAHDAMVTSARVARGEWVLVHAAGSGVGTAVVQLAHVLGARVIGTSRTPAKLARCEALGLDAGVVAPRMPDGALDADALAWAVVEATGGGAHVVLDLVGGEYVTADVNAAAPRGRIVCIGTIAGGRAALPVGALLAKRLTLVGTVLRSRDTAEKAAATAAFARDVVPRIADRSVAPVIDAVYPLARAGEAYARLESDASFGKVVLDCR